MRSKTAKAVEELRHAHAERSRDAVLGPVVAAIHEQRAQELLELEAPLERGAGGEVIPPRGGGTAQSIVRETLAQGATAVAADASMARADLLVPLGGALPLALDVADSIAASNSVERLLAHQLGAAHEAGMRLLAEGLQRVPRDSVEGARLANTAARLFSVFQDGLLTLQRLRGGGGQTVRVEHLHVAPGGQALVAGNVEAGGAKRRGRK